MTNYALEQMLVKLVIGLTRVAVGYRYIFEEMQRSGAMLGAEPSGHIIFSDFPLSGDCLLTTLKLAQAIVETGQSLDELLVGVVDQRQGQIPVDGLDILPADIGCKPAQRRDQPLSLSGPVPPQIVADRRQEPRQGSPSLQGEHGVVQAGRFV